MEILVRELRTTDAPVCAEILAALPDWFGLPETNRESIEGLSRLPAAVAEREGRVIGFVSIERYETWAAEIPVMAVDPDHHRCGAGRALVAWVETWCVEAGVRWLHVKTRGPSTPDPGYEKTRRFYLAMGFDPLFESLTLWGPEDAALILVKAVGVHGVQ